MEENEQSEEGASKLDQVMYNERMSFVTRNNARGRGFYHSNIFTKEISGICATFAIIVVVVFFIFSLLALTIQSEPPVTHIVTIDPEAPAVFRTNPMFVSIALDSSVIADGFRTFDMMDERLVTMMAYLGPCYLRIGGTMADRLIFVPENQPSFKTSQVTEIDGGIYSYEDHFANPVSYPNFTMSGEEWLNLNILAARSNMVVLFDLNCLIRHKNGSWNSKNAEELIRYSDKHNLNVMWELGNEPNSFRHVFNYEVNATQLAADFQTLRNILNKYPMYKESFLVGPDVTRPRPNHRESLNYMKEFLTHIGDNINAITWHQYYMNGRTAILQDFLNPTIFNLLGEQIKKIREAVTDVGYDEYPIWLGETSSAYGGGAPGFSNRYISTFIWLDKLGLAARNGISLVVRQSVYKGHYALLREHYEPTPDWWLTILYKAFVGPEVLPCMTVSSPKVRFYCHCTNKEDVYGVGNAITVFGINMQETEAKIRIEGLSPKTSKYMPPIFAYVTSAHLTILSKIITLNGETLIMKNDGELPVFQPFLIEKASYLAVPPYSSAFFVIPNTNVKACSSPYYFES